MKKIRIKSQQYNKLFEDSKKQLFEADPDNPAGIEHSEIKVDNSDSDSGSAGADVTVDKNQVDDSGSKEARKDDNTDDNDSSNEVPAVKFKYQGNPSNTEKILKFAQDNVTMSMMGFASAFNVKMTQDFSKNVMFPTAPTQLQSLMLQTTMPKKFRNIYSSYDNNPLLTIEKAEDMAVKYFSVFTGGSESKDTKAKNDASETSGQDGQDAKEDNKQETDVQSDAEVIDQAQQAADSQAQNQDNTTPIQNASTGTPENASTGGTANPNESFYFYNQHNVLNEDMAAAAGAGLKIGAAGSNIIAHAAAFGASAFAGLIPGMAVVMGLGALSAAGQGEYITNDKELLKTYDEEVAQKKSLQNSYYQAIDNYVNSVLASMDQCIRHITSDQGNKKFSDMHAFIVNALSKDTDTAVKSIIQNNNEELKKSRQQKIDELKKSNSALTRFKQDMDYFMKNNKTFAENEQVQRYFAEYKSRSKDIDID